MPCFIALLTMSPETSSEQEMQLVAPIVVERYSVEEHERESEDLKLKRAEW